MPRDPFVPSGERDAQRRSRERERDAGRASRERAGPDRSVRRRRALAAGVLAIVSGAVILTIALAGGRRERGHGASAAPPSGAQHANAGHEATRMHPSSYAVGLKVLRLVDTSRTIQLPDGRTQARTLLTYVRYPALGAPGRVDLPGAPPEPCAPPRGPFASATVSATAPLMSTSTPPASARRRRIERSGLTGSRSGEGRRASRSPLGVEGSCGMNGTRDSGSR